ncbi:MULTISPECIES: helix-turn-helix domain-containing protein [Halorubrum]|nr:MULTISPECIES: helix-turn-helix domain-containing protein [Halorubrum]TKX72070.1 helix-turn-helix domain-containing protein [Halorubrum sp. GN11GM_10-3_MGM]
MSRTDLRLDLPTGSWLGDVSRRVPAATLRVAETIAIDGDGRQSTGADPETAATVRVGGTERDRVEAALRDHERVSRATAVEPRGDVRTLRVVGRAPAYLPAARAVGLPIESTVEVVDGRAAVTVVGDRGRIEAFGRRLAGDGITVEVAATGDADADRTLTEAQRELVFEAVRAGYYDTPRRCTLTALAEANDIAKSTCSETLHRAEGRVMRRFVDGAGPFASAADAGAAATDETGPPETATFDGHERDGEEPVRSAATEP